MVNYATLNDKISDAIVNGDDLNTLKTQWLGEVDKISTFVEMFLDRYGNRVLGEKDQSPEWKLYTSKTDDYNTYTRAIRNVDYFIAKQKLTA